MTRLQFISPDSATGQTKELYDGIKQNLGKVPNMMQALGSSPAALSGYLNLHDALSQGELGPQDRERIALIVAELNGCDYCLAAHSAIGKLVGLSPSEISESRQATTVGVSNALLEFTKRVVETKGHVTDEDLDVIRGAGYSDAQIAEIVVNVALNTLTNFFNSVAKPEIDFPKAAPLAALSS